MVGTAVLGSRSAGWGVPAGTVPAGSVAGRLIVGRPAPGSSPPAPGIPLGPGGGLSGCALPAAAATGRLPAWASSASRAAASSASRGCETSRARIALSSEIFIPDIRPVPSCGQLPACSVCGLRAAEASRPLKPADRVVPASQRDQKIWQVQGACSNDIAAASRPAAPGVSSRTWPAPASCPKLAPPR